MDQPEAVRGPAASHASGAPPRAPVTPQRDADPSAVAQALRIASDVARLAVWQWDVAADRASWVVAHPGVLDSETAPGAVPLQEFLTGVHAEDRGRTANAIRAGLEQHAFETVFRGSRRDGSVGFYRCACRVARERGAPVTVHGVVTDVTDDRNAMDAVRDGEGRFSRFMQHLPGVAWLKDDAGRYIFVNSAAPRFFGRSSSELLGRTDADLFAPEIAARLREREQAAQAEPNGVQAIETPLTPEERHFLVNRFVVIAGPTRAPFAGAIAIDITARVESQRALETARDELEQRVRERTSQVEEATARFKAVFEQGTCAAIVSLDGSVLEVNRTWLQQSGFAENDVVGRKLWLAPWWGRSADLQAWAKIGFAEATRGARFQGESACHGADGAERRLELALMPIFQATGELSFILATGSDVTERHRWAQERQRMDVARETEARFRRMANYAPVLIWMIDEDNQGTWFNQQWLNFAGRPLESELGAGWLAGVHADDQERVVRMRGQAVASQRPFEMEFRLRRRDGEFRWVLDHGVPTFGHDGRFSGYIGTCIDITERKRAERTVQRLAAIVASSGDSIVAVDLDGYVTHWNEAAERLYGYAAIEMIGQPVTLLVPAARRREDEALTGRIIAGESVEHFETQRCRKDGANIDVSVSMSPLRDENGAIVGVSRIARDITERKRTEAELRRREQVYRAIGESINYGIWVGDAAGQLLYVSDSLSALVGERLEERAGTAWMDVLHPDDREETRRSWLASLRAGTQWEREHRFMDTHGGAHPVLSRGVPVRDENGEIARWVGIHLDVSRLKQNEEALRESEERFRNLADNIAQFAWIADADGRIFWFNQRWFEYTGLDLVATDRREWQRVNHPDHEERVVEKFRRCIDEGVVWEDTFPLRRRDGVFRWFLSRAVPIRDGEGRVVRWFGTNTDITDMREIEHELKRARDDAVAASRAKDDFLAALSHELRTPLNPVLLLASDAADDAALPPQVRADFAAIRKQVSLEARLIDDLLDLTRISRGILELDPGEHDLNGLVHDALATVAGDAAEKSIDVEVSLDPSEPRVRADAVRMQQALWNVFKNAVKFTPPGGAIHVATRGAGDGRTVDIEVTDTGIGFSAEELPRIFEAFSQGNHAKADAPQRFGGLGLGLTISRRVVEMHGGRIVASSDGHGRGACFVITLPRVEAAAAVPGDAPGGATASREPIYAGSRVLLVEDHVPTRAALKRLLVRRGFEVVSADCASEARAAMRDVSFDLLISDIGLPDGSGCDLMRECTAVRAVPGIALTGYGMEQDIARSRDAGFCAHLIKPVGIQALDHAIAAALPQRAGTATHP